MERKPWKTATSVLTLLLVLMYFGVMVNNLRLDEVFNRFRGTIENPFGEI